MDKKENIQKREVLLEKTDKRIAYEAEGKRRMQIRKDKRNNAYRALAQKAQDIGCSISSVKYNAPWRCSSSPTGWRQICSYQGTCESPCNGDC